MAVIPAKAELLLKKEKKSLEKTILIIKKLRVILLLHSITKPVMTKILFNTF